MKKLKVNKLFYNKWPYKVECIIHGANKISIYGSGRVLAWCDNELEFIGHKDSVKNINKEELKKFIKIAEPYIWDKENVKVRNEGRHFNLFVKDQQLFKKIQKDLKQWLYAVYEPSNLKELNFLLASKNKQVLCDLLPYGKYSYKVVLKNAPESIRAKFYTWTQSYSEDQIKISNETVRWLSGKMHWKQDPFFYVSNGPMMTLTRLFLGEHVRHVYEYVPRSSLAKG